MDKVYKTIYKFGQDETIINKSRFIGYAMPVEDEDQAIAFIEKIKSMHRDATHNVYAYVVGQNNNIQRFSDDGEPSGTAGIPVLEVIKKENLRNLVLVVTRYFGGIKLGTGGLIRAYTRGAKIGLEAGIIVDMVLHSKLKVRLDYNLYGKIENYLLSKEYIIDDTLFDEAVNIVLYVRDNQIESFQRDMRDMTSGSAYIQILDEEYIAIKEGEKLA
ncbi:MAG: YigZ family protein [Tissierellaceae bacterium]